MMARAELPLIALSVRQPWAWAIIHAGKDIENRSTFAVSKGGMKPKRICIHAAQKMTREEYESGRCEIERLRGDVCPAPDKLVRGGIIGAATVVGVVRSSDSPWFCGPRGLEMREAAPCAPIPCVGELGYFTWRESDRLLAETLPWMVVWPGYPGRRARDDQNRLL